MYGPVVRRKRIIFKPTDDRLGGLRRELRGTRIRTVGRKTSSRKESRNVCTHAKIRTRRPFGAVCGRLATLHLLLAVCLAVPLTLGGTATAQTRGSTAPEGSATPRTPAATPSVTAAPPPAAVATMLKLSEPALEATELRRANLRRVRNCNRRSGARAPDRDLSQLSSGTGRLRNRRARNTLCGAGRGS